MATATKTKPKARERHEDPPAPAATPPSESVQTLDVLERKIDANKEVLQRAAMRDYRRRTEPGVWADLPNGESVRVSGHVGMGYPGEDATLMLGSPEQMLLAPKPPFSCGPRYQWRVRTSADPKDNRPAATAAAHRAGRIRYVETDEIDVACPFAVYTEYATTNNTYVTYMSMILCELLDERLCYQTYKGWEDYSISKVVNLAADVRSDKDTHIENKTDVDLSIKDVRRGG